MKKYSMTHHTVKSVEEAWKLANEIFPTDYEKNDEYSVNAGYPVYESTSATYGNAYIRDLGVRFEINIDEEWYNIWIEEDEIEEAEETAEEIEAEEVEEVEATEIETEEVPALTSEDYAETMKNQYTFEPENAVIIRFHVMGYSFEPEAQRRMYRAMNAGNEFERNQIAMELGVAYCVEKGIDWASLRTLDVQHFSGANGGHYVVSCIVTLKPTEAP